MARNSACAGKNRLPRTSPAATPADSTRRRRRLGGMPLRQQEHPSIRQQPGRTLRRGRHGLPAKGLKERQQRALLLGLIAGAVPAPARVSRAANCPSPGRGVRIEPVRFVQGKVRVRVQKGLHRPLVFVRGECAGGIYQPPARPYRGGGTFPKWRSGARRRRPRAPPTSRDGLGFAADMPSPEQGASTSTASNAPGSASQSASGRMHVTTALENAETLQRALQDGGAPRHGLVCHKQAGVLQLRGSCPALPPGAAH